MGMFEHWVKLEDQEFENLHPCLLLITINTLVGMYPLNDWFVFVENIEVC